jgi:hypothetical protein
MEKWSIGQTDTLRKLFLGFSLLQYLNTPILLELTHIPY